MAGRNMSLDVIVRLRDMLSGPLRRLRGTLDGIANMSRRLGLVAGAVAAISFVGPLQEAAAFQQKLLDIAGTQNLVGQQAYKSVEEMRRQYEDLANAVGLSTEDIASAAGQMIAAGLDKALVDTSLPGIGKAAKAANASMSDMAAVATSLLQTLKLPAEQLDDMLAGLVVGGKLGAFELKDMAKYFPTLTGQMAKLGVTGREAGTQLAAMLQIARKGTADPAEAANNLNNFLSKITSPETRKNFEKMGVDIQGVMQDAATKGINPIEAVIQKISKLTGVTGAEINGLMEKAKANGLTGAEALEHVRTQLEAIHGAGALGELFSDMQVMGFLIPMLANIDEYKRIRDEVAKATGAMTDADFETQMQSLNTQIIIFKNLRDQVTDEIGFAFGEWLPEINRYLSDAILYLRQLDKETGGAVRQWLAFAAAGVLAATALGALGFVLPAVGAGLSLVTGPLFAAGRGAFLLTRYFAGAARSSIALQAALGAMQGSKLSGLGALTTGLRGMALAIPGISGLTGILGGIATAAAAVTWPIWALAAGVAAVGLAVFNYWEPIKNWVGGFATGVSSAVAELTSGLGKVNEKVLEMAGQKLLDIADWLGIDPQTIASVIAKVVGIRDSIVEVFRSLGGFFRDLLSDIFTMNDYSAEEEANFRSAGERMGKAMVDGIIAAFNALFEFFRGLAQQIVNLVGRIDISSLIQWPTPPAWLSRLWGGGEPPAPAAPGNDNAPAPAPAAAPGKRASLSPIVPSGIQTAQNSVDVGGTLNIGLADGLVITKAEANDKRVAMTNTGRLIGRA